MYGSLELCDLLYKAKSPTSQPDYSRSPLLGLLGAAGLAAEDPVKVTRQATFLFFSLPKVWPFLKSCNLVGLLFF